ncbi:hypothetical protein MMAGJ_07900 [Mycolicibacterium mageritense]|uniref:Uncharacterized protein n=1 Tax=Mycolicibacterium mageritense TaxID=53462 RepID=A0ABM7HLX7_MYCME|nr:hypothetical protein MMAGJ_07900 [Mycolicibacterium mageritense]
MLDELELSELEDFSEDDELDDSELFDEPLDELLPESRLSVR